MSIRLGLVGLPNVGKSSLFNLLTNSHCSAENFPFCTLEPNQGRVAVADPRLDRLAACVHPQRLVPETLELVDVAGLVKGASSGEGLGNKFLSHVREVDALFHVVRLFEAPRVTHVAGRVDPLADLETIETELMLADLETIERWISRHKSGAASRTPEGIQRLALLKKLVLWVGEGRPVRAWNWGEGEKELLQGLPLLTQKPMLVVANVDEGFEDGASWQALVARCQAENLQVIAIALSWEQNWAACTPEERADLYPDLPADASKINSLADAARQLLGLSCYFTVGVQEVRAWFFPKGAKAPQAAGVIHSDFERGFIRAEVIHIDDFLSCGSEQAAKMAGKMRLEGRHYSVEDGDILQIRFNV